MLDDCSGDEGGHRHHRRFLLIVGVGVYIESMMCRDGCLSDLSCIDGEDPSVIRRV